MCRCSLARGRSGLDHVERPFLVKNSASSPNGLQRFRRSFEQCVEVVRVFGYPFVASKLGDEKLSPAETSGLIDMNSVRART